MNQILPSTCTKSKENMTPWYDWWPNIARYVEILTQLTSALSNKRKKERIVVSCLLFVSTIYFMKCSQELLKETHQFLAQHLESEGNLRDAEHHYCEANEWLSAVNMYRSNNMWEEAIRVAKVCGFQLLYALC
jgi:hypothetical protein